MVWMADIHFVIPAKVGTHFPNFAALLRWPPCGMPPEMGPRVRGDDNLWR